MCVIDLCSGQTDTRYFGCDQAHVPRVAERARLSLAAANCGTILRPKGRGNKVPPETEDELEGGVFHAHDQSADPQG